MNRSTLALCILSLSPACAMAAPEAGSVSIYGLVDLGLYRSNQGATQIGTIQRSSVGFRGIEPLGGGLSATFNLQMRFDADTGQREGSGAAPAFQGESTVGLKGDFGAVRLGRALAPLGAQDWAFDPWGNFNRIASPAWQIFHPSYRTDPHNNGPIGEYSRLNNGVFYDSPTLGGFSLHGAASLEKATTPDANGFVDRTRGMGLSLNYAQGPYAAMLAGERNSANDKSYFTGASWKTGNTTFMGSYSHTQLSAESQAFLGDRTARRRSATLGLVHAAGANTFRLGLGRDFEGYGNNGATNHVGLGISHALSKRTAIYADLGLQKARDNERGARYGVGVSHGF